ncbi:MAG TPA: LLM class flavin-dependent oxidoreductase [Aggregatilineaceae bacterium]|nr:LLM class flavin-dependent oxidoreductase [Aggregatilineaceae bacterium]
MQAAERGFQIGVMFRREHPVKYVQEFIRLAEKTGFDEVWLVEDCFFTSGIAAVATALACPAQIPIGLGIMPGVARNPAFTAMEIATLAGLYPGRFLPGIGHGMPEWMKQIGAAPASPVKALEEITTVIRALLRGETVSFDGQYIHLDRVRLEFPPEVVPPISLGVRGPKSITMAGRTADGTILAECASPAYIAYARGLIAQGQPDRQAHRLTVYTFCEVDDDAQAARDRLRPLIAPIIASGGIHSQIAPLGIVPQVDALLAEGGAARLEAEMPDEWIDQLAVVGTPADCAAALQRMAEAGADSIVFIPPMEQPEQWISGAASRVLAAL